VVGGYERPGGGVGIGDGLGTGLGHRAGHRGGHAEGPALGLDSSDGAGSGVPEGCKLAEEAGLICATSPSVGPGGGIQGAATSAQAITRTAVARTADLVIRDITAEFGYTVKDPSSAV
jgi:hypothetical protein